MGIACTGDTGKKTSDTQNKYTVCGFINADAGGHRVGLSDGFNGETDATCFKSDHENKAQ